MRVTFFHFFIIVSYTSFAQWNTNPIINTPVALASKSQGNTHAVSDTKGGIIVSWDDNRNSLTNSSDIYAQRLKKNGFEKWTSNGQAICTDNSTQKSSVICNNNDGSAIITWEDNRAGNYDIYAQKIDSSGNILWALNGIAVCSNTTKQKNPKIVNDNNGGAIIVWEDSLNNFWDITAQRISSNGTLLWTANGISVCSSPNTQNNPKIETDSLGGAIITWQDKRNNTDYDIYAQRINSSGTALWAANGVVICNAINTQNNPRIEPDGSNGAIIGWTDKRNANDNNIYAQRIDAAGVVQWTTNGLMVCNASNNQSALDIKYIGLSGLMLSWKDDRSATNEIYAQLVSLSGVTQLTANGILISNGSKSINPNTISDGLGGAIIAWQDSSGLGWDIKSQSINSAGVVQWAIGGVTVTKAGDDQINPSHVTDGNGGAIYVWEDRRNGSNYDLYANHLFYNGSSIVGVKELSKNNSLQAVCFPNPIESQSIIKLKNNTLSLPWEIKIYDTFGNLIKTQRLKHDESFSMISSEYSSGVYFYVIHLSGENSYTKGNFILTN